MNLLSMPARSQAVAEGRRQYLADELNALDHGTPSHCEPKLIKPLSRLNISSTFSYGDRERDEPDENSSFTIVKGHSRRKAPHKTGPLNHSPANPLRGKRDLTVGLKPRDRSQKTTKPNLLKLHKCLESIAPDGVMKVRPNHRRNVLTLDTRNI